MPQIAFDNISSRIDRESRTVSSISSVNNATHVGGIVSNAVSILTNKESIDIVFV